MGSVINWQLEKKGSQCGKVVKNVKTSHSFLNYDQSSKKTQELQQENFFENSSA